MSTLIKEVDARTRLAGANRMELLLFSLGGEEVFGINVFKVREVMKLPPLTKVPETDGRIEGMANLRGKTVPVVNLLSALKIETTDVQEGAIPAGNLIVAEYNQSLQGLHVAGVDRIIRISWDQVKPPPPLMRNVGGGGAVTAVTTLEDGRMVLILDVEKVLSDICPRPDEEVYAGLKTVEALKARHVMFADDSLVARTQIRKTLERLGITFHQATTGREAWTQLAALADKAQAEGKSIREEVHLILSDIEMPEMDGFALTKQVRSDPRFNGIPIILHSSLTGVCNEEKGKSVGATDYVTKFDPKILTEKILKHIEA
ncbi:MAG: chemotaxis protein CheV [Nitrospirota bacterium]|nr:chemotaxis protein CheV [Nitrospirota bacterium]MDE3225678.1 chemotaxis protein CheV [Nitrospirota bacterium]MDE3241149.1 chemotaxis protein CheV [Nitrospirota bacterium]